jgi:hypothetical protein
MQADLCPPVFHNSLRGNGVGGANCSASIRAAALSFSQIGVHAADMLVWSCCTTRH